MGLSGLEGGSLLTTPEAIRHRRLEEGKAALEVLAWNGKGDGPFAIFPVWAIGGATRGIAPTARIFLPMQVAFFMSVLSIVHEVWIEGVAGLMANLGVLKRLVMADPDSGYLPLPPAALVHLVVKDEGRPLASSSSTPGLASSSSSSSALASFSSSCSFSFLLTTSSASLVELIEEAQNISKSTLKVSQRILEIHDLVPKLWGRCGTEELAAGLEEVTAFVRGDGCRPEALGQGRTDPLELAAAEVLRRLGVQEEARARESWAKQSLGQEKRRRVTTSGAKKPKPHKEVYEKQSAGFIVSNSLPVAWVGVGYGRSLPRSRFPRLQVPLPERGRRLAIYRYDQLVRQKSEEELRTEGAVEPARMDDNRAYIVVPLI